MNLVEEIKNEIDNLISEGKEMLLDLSKEEKEVIGNSKNIFAYYQTWYTKCIHILKNFNPDRLEEFKILYKNPNRKEIDWTNYTVSDALLGMNMYMGPTKKDAIPRLLQQIGIIESTKSLLELNIYRIKEILQANIFESELKSAEELNKKGFYRAAGAICGVIIETHLAKVLSNHNISVNKKNPTINDFNELLKNNELIEITTWRKIQYLADIRNICDHKKDTEPVKEDIEDLISGTNKIIKMVE